MPEQLIVPSIKQHQVRCITEEQKVDFLVDFIKLIHRRPSGAVMIFFNKETLLKVYKAVSKVTYT